MEKTRHHIQHDHQPDSASDKLWNPWSDNDHLSWGSYLVWALYDKYKYKFRHEDNQNVHTTTKKTLQGLYRTSKIMKTKVWKLENTTGHLLCNITACHSEETYSGAGQLWSIMNILSAHKYLAKGIKNETTPQLCSGSKTRNKCRNMGTESSQSPRHLKTRFKL